MLEILKLNRLQKLSKQYKVVKEEAKRLMSSGDLRNYILKLAEAEKLKTEYFSTLKI